MVLEKAKIYIIGDDSKRDESKFFQVMFNPQSYKINNSPNSGLNEGKGRNKQITRAINRTLSFSLFFDTYSLSSKINMNVKQQDVRAYTLEIVNLMKENKKCQFVWGTFVFTGVISSIEENYELFLPEGIPVRVNLSVTMIECGVRDGLNPPQTQEKINDNVPVEVEYIFTKLVELKGKAPEKWREVAKQMGINNPRI